jgi:NitT/TauT family transport system substrate-binding protein
MIRKGKPRQSERVSGMTRRSILRGALGLLATARFGFPSVPATAATGIKRATLRFNWTIKGEFTGFFVAQEKGFYREENVELQLLEGKSGTQAAQVVGAGSDQFGYIPSVQVIKAINEDIPLKTVATLGRYTGMCWASWPNVPLKTPKDLEGRKVSISTSSTFFQVWPAFARKFKVDVNKVEVVNADPSARVGLFLSHKLDIMADIFLANDYIILQARTKEPLNLLKLSDLHFDPLGYLLVVNTSVLARDPELVRRVTKATLKGFRYTVDHPDEAIAIMTRLYGERLGPEVIQGQVTRLVPLINQTPALGKASEAEWANSLTILFISGVIDKRLALKAYHTDEFIGG